MSKTRKQLIGILALYLLLAFGYGLSNPLFEAPDAQHHFFTARYIAETGTLPTTLNGGELLRQEAAQPPLYYLLAAPLVALVNTRDAESELWSNPTVLIGEPRPINANSFVHTAQEAWPWTGYALAAHLVRFLSTFIGLGTLLCIFGSGRLIWPESPAIALLATALVAFLPQFVFLHGSINNDVLIIFLCSLALWQLTWLWYKEVTTPRLLFLGLTIGLAVLTKMAGLMLLPLAVLVFTLKAWCDGREQEQPFFWKDLLRSSLLVILPALLVSGWLLWRNWTLYGDMTAMNQFVELAGGVRPYSLRQVWHDMDRVVLSAVAFFGWMNVLAPRWLYQIWAAILLTAASGWVFAAWRRSEGDHPEFNERLKDGFLFLWMGAWVFLVFAAWLRFMLQTPADQGRLLFPALLPVTLLVARGIAAWRLSWLPWLLTAAAFFTSAYGLLVVIPDAYNTAELLAENQIPQDAARTNIDMGQGITLLATETLTDAVQAGEWVWVELYWRASQIPQEAPFERLGLYGRDNALAGSQVNYHGGGNYPASEWPANQVVRDRVAVQLSKSAELPAQLRLLMRIDENREPLEIARVKGIPEQWPPVHGEPLALFGEAIELMSASVSPEEVRPGSAVKVRVTWRVKNAPGQALTTFVHLGDPRDAPLAQADSPAVSGQYPTESWAGGEVIEDVYELLIPQDLEAGSYPVQIGFYEPGSGLRLSVSAAGVPEPNDAYFIGSLTVDGE